MDVTKKEGLKKEKGRIEVSTEKTVSRAGKVENSMKGSKGKVQGKSIFGRTSDAKETRSA